MTSHPSNFSGSDDSVVFLVGAGPGDPGLITVRGAALLASADVVIYDALANPLLMRHCSKAEKIYVGKRAAAHSMTQEQINQLLIDQARQQPGRRVVRLKGGDPFVFGRGGEECEALVAAKIRFEVVPGVTAAIAAPAYAGIPVTHRDFNSSFTFITGHEKEEQYKETEAKGRDAGAGSDVDWAAVAKLPCIAFYMGVKSLPRICAKLMEHGMSADTPAATIRWGTTPKQRTIVGTVSNLAARVAEAKISPPAMTIIGRVVSMRETMNWFEQRPLFGRTIVVTRTRDQASGLSAKLSELGANILEAPTIELSPAADLSRVDAVLRGLASQSQPQFDWIVFTSANGVMFARQRLFELGLDARAFGTAKIAAIGDATADAIERDLSLRVDIRPEQFVGEALAEALIARADMKGKRVLLLRADIARQILREKLEQAGAIVEDVAIYETRPVAALPEELVAAIEAGEVDWITFTSSSTVKNFWGLLGEDLQAKLTGAKLASIGPITSATMRELGLNPAVEAEQFNVPGLVKGIIKAES